jgi:hypothetical protein
VRNNNAARITQRANDGGGRCGKKLDHTEDEDLQEVNSDVVGRGRGVKLCFSL